jgi:hypothetical protein
MTVGPSEILSGPKNGLTERLTPGGHTHWATPIMATSNEIDTTSFVASLVPSNPRMITRSSSNPNAGARIRSTMISAKGVDHPHFTRICQYANAASMPAAPCAKLKTPVVVYVSTRPLAITA